MVEARGNVLGVQEGIVAHGCNALGVMGAGFAKKVKLMHPAAFAAYKEQERSEGLALGKVSFAQVGPRLWIANVVAQERIYGPQGVFLGDLDGIQRGFEAVASKARELGLQVEMPLIGCGLAHGVWADIQPRILAGLGDVPSRVWIFEPSPKRAPPARSPR